MTVTKVKAATSVLAMAVMATYSAVGGELPRTMVTDSPSYGTCQDAAIAALGRIRSNDTELGGAILKVAGGSYRFTLPVGKGNNAKVAYVILKHKDDSLCAVYHNHPYNDRLNKRERNELGMFSTTDMDTVRKLDVPSYMVEGIGYTVHVIDRSHTGPGYVGNGVLVASL